MEPKGIFPTVTLEIDTWNQERDEISQKVVRNKSRVQVIWINWSTCKIQIIHTEMNSTKCQIEFLVNSESFFEFEVDCMKSMKKNQVFLAGSEENAEPYPGEIRSVFIWIYGSKLKAFQTIEKEHIFVKTYQKL